MLESDLCIEFYKQYQLLTDLRQFNLPKYVFHIPNERKTSISYGRKLKRMGVIPGIADYCVLFEGGVAFIEFKRNKKCKLSEHQLIFRERCKLLKIPYLMTCSIEDAMDFIKQL